MYSEIISSLKGFKLQAWLSFLEASDLHADSLIDKTVILWDNDKIAATGSRYNNILKFVAVDPSYRGEDLTSRVISELRKDAFDEGFRSLFLYTKPENETIFSSIFFYPIVKTENIVLLEDKKDGIRQFVTSLPHADKQGVIGSIVMNCNPFTKGHQYLVEQAAHECDHVYVFVLSEDKSEFSFADRFEMVKLGTEHIDNVTVVPTGPYLISSATFPTYFLKDRDNVSEAQCKLDIEVFVKHFVPSFGVSRRYIGTEPLSALTNKYNEALKRLLPLNGVEVVEVARKNNGDEPISASKVRKLIHDGKSDELSSFIPETTLKYLIKKELV